MKSAQDKWKEFVGEYEGKMDPMLLEMSKLAFFSGYLSGKMDTRNIQDVAREVFVELNVVLNEAYIYDGERQS